MGSDNLFQWIIACIIKHLRTLGITGFHDLTATNEQFLLSGNQLKQKYSKVFKKHIIAINRLAELVNLPSTEDLTAETISSILNKKEPLSTLDLAHVRSTTPPSQRYGTLTSLRHHHRIFQPTTTLNLIQCPPFTLCPRHSHDPPAA